MTEQVINKMDGKRVSRERGERIDEEGVWGVCVVSGMQRGEEETVSESKDITC